MLDESNYISEHRSELLKNEKEKIDKYGGPQIYFIWQISPSTYFLK